MYVCMYVCMYVYSFILQLCPEASWRGFALLLQLHAERVVGGLGQVGRAWVVLAGAGAGIKVGPSRVLAVVPGPHRKSRDPLSLVVSRLVRRRPWRERGAGRLGLCPASHRKGRGLGRPLLVHRLLVQGVMPRPRDLVALELRVGLLPAQRERGRGLLGREVGRVGARARILVHARSRRDSALNCEGRTPVLAHDVLPRAGRALVLLSGPLEALAAAHRELGAGRGGATNRIRRGSGRVGGPGLLVEPGSDAILRAALLRGVHGVRPGPRRLVELGAVRVPRVLVGGEPRRPGGAPERGVL